MPPVGKEEDEEENEGERSPATVYGSVKTELPILWSNLPLLLLLPPPVLLLWCFPSVPLASTSSFSLTADRCPRDDWGCVKA